MVPLVWLMIGIKICFWTEPTKTIKDYCTYITSLRQAIVYENIPFFWSRNSFASLDGKWIDLRFNAFWPAFL